MKKQKTNRRKASRTTDRCRRAYKDGRHAKTGTNKESRNRRARVGKSTSEIDDPGTRSRNRREANDQRTKRHKIAYTRSAKAENIAEPSTRARSEQAARPLQHRNKTRGKAGEERNALQSDTVQSGCGQHEPRARGADNGECDRMDRRAEQVWRTERQIAAPST